MTRQAKNRNKPQPGQGEPEVLPRLERDGCQFSASCLQCPLPACKHDMTGAELRSYQRARQDEETARAVNERGLSPEEAAREFGVTTRTVFRILERTRQANRQ